MKEKGRVFRAFALVTQLGLSVITPVLLCVWLGTWLEGKTGWNLVIPLIIIGILAGGRNGYVLLRQALADPEDGEDGKR